MSEFALALEEEQEFDDMGHLTMQRYRQTWRMY